MPLALEPLCAHCHSEPVAPEWRPFCRERCKLLDLARWVDGGYRIAGEPMSEHSDHGDPSPTEALNGQRP